MLPHPAWVTTSSPANYDVEGCQNDWKAYIDGVNLCQQRREDA
jgi:hypothetical protein